jgi:Tfp pilus assembly protein PilW
MTETHSTPMNRPGSKRVRTRALARERRRGRWAARATSPGGGRTAYSAHEWVHREGRCGAEPHANDAGFSIAEFLISTVILLGISAAVFSLLGDTQRSSSYQTEVQATLENSRIAMDTVERYIRQAGNDPKNVGFTGVTITSTTQMRFRSDLTGSAVGNSDKGDPDGDTNDSGEDVTIQYNAGNRSIDVTPQGGAAQSIANYISAFTMEGFDSAGAATTDGTQVKKIRISITGSTTLPDPKTGLTYSLQLQSDVQLATRQ